MDGSTWRSVRLLGLDFADLDVAAAAGWLARRPASAPFGYVTTPNADHLVRLNRRPELATINRDALMRLLDSRVVARAARLVGLAAPHVVPGSDLTALLLAQHITAGERITIVGLQPEWLPALASRCGIAPPAHHNPPHGFARDPDALRAAVEFVLMHPARFVFLAVGSPRQEILAEAIASTRQATGVGLCIGASLEFLVGAARRSPLWMQHAGLEWLHRLGNSPRRLARRYLWDCPSVFPMLLNERLAQVRNAAVTGVPNALSAALQTPRGAVEAVASLDVPRRPLADRPGRWVTDSSDAPRSTA
jgi:N-acetylglucosaminyldiphosphoundecaprenol N-acetyl-beta-D-mannosaminyltransferase